MAAVCVIPERPLPILTLSGLLAVAHCADASIGPLVHAQDGTHARIGVQRYKLDLHMVLARQLLHLLRAYLASLLE